MPRDNYFFQRGYFSAEKFLVFAPARSQGWKKIIVAEHKI
jgi:hypothetical protein